MKRKIIKNLACLLGALVALVCFLIVTNNLTLADKLQYLLPFYMVEVTIAVFSLNWSLRESNKNNMLNMGIILGTILFAFIFIILEAVSVVFIKTAENSEFMKNAMIVFFALGGIGSLFDFGYALFIDFFKSKKQIKA